MAQISWTVQALADLEAIGDFIARDAPSFAQVFVDGDRVSILTVFHSSRQLILSDLTSD